MQILKMAGAKFTPQLFINLYAEARKLSPPRFMTLRLHPDRYKELHTFADIPESIQLGDVLGPLGRRVMRVCCVRNPSGLGDGITIREDSTCDLDKLYFEIHGQPELVIEELYVEPPNEPAAESNTKPLIN
jgi:hypothetical protein